MSSQVTLADGKGNLSSLKDVQLCNVCSRAHTIAQLAPAMSMEETLLRLITELASMLGSGMTPNVNELNHRICSKHFGIICFGPRHV